MPRSVYIRLAPLDAGLVIQALNLYWRVHTDKRKRQAVSAIRKNFKRQWRQMIHAEKV